MNFATLHNVSREPLNKGAGTGSTRYVSEAENSDPPGTSQMEVAMLEKQNKKDGKLQGILWGNRKLIQT